jgi:hypothetical protein
MQKRWMMESRWMSAEIARRDAIKKHTMSQLRHYKQKTS